MAGLLHSHIKESFAGTVVYSKEENKKAISLFSQRYFQHILNTKFPVGDKVTLMLTSQKPKRTLNQNSYYWGVYLPLIAEKMSGETHRYEIVALHERFKDEFLTVVVKEVLGKSVRIKKSTSELSVSDFCEYVLNIEKLTGVEAPPTENYSLPALIRQAPEIEVEQTIE